MYGIECYDSDTCDTHHCWLLLLLVFVVVVVVVVVVYLFDSFLEVHQGCGGGGTATPRQ